MILDVDGTLVDSNDAHAHAWAQSMKHEGSDVPYEEVRCEIGMGSDKLLPNTVGVQKDSPEGKRLTKGWEEIFKSDYLPNLKAFPGSKALLQRMRSQGLKLVVASSTEASLLKSLLEIADATGLIRDKTSSSDAKQSKPDPDIVQAALDNLEMPPNQAVMLGDTPYDVEAASRAGVSIITLRCGGWSDKDLAGAIAIYDDPADLLAHYDSSPLA